VLRGGATRALLGASLGVRQPGTWPEARGCRAECGGAPSRNVSISGRPQPEPEHGTLSPPATPPPDARQHYARWRAPASSVILPARVRPMLAPRRDRTPGVDRAGLLRGHAVPQRDAPLLHPADVHADGAAALRRQPRRVDHGHDVLPGRPAGGLRLRPLHLAPAVAAGPGGRPPRAPARRALHAADRRGCGLAAATRSPHRLVARGPRRLPGAPVLCPRRQRTDAAALVRPDGASGQPQPLLPLRVEQPGEHPGAARLSGPCCASTSRPSRGRRATGASS
jgi:hypothetical protein